jgi:hypothetical protein
LGTQTAPTGTPRSAMRHVSIRQLPTFTYAAVGRVFTLYALMIAGQPAHFDPQCIPLIRYGCHLGVERVCMWA